MIQFQDYSKTYTTLPIEILIFFSERETKDGILIPKTLYSFCEYYHKKYNTQELPQPCMVSKICDILSDNQYLSIIKKGGIDNMDSSYWCTVGEEFKTDIFNQTILNKKLSNIIYGFKYIYENYRMYILAVIFTDNRDDLSIGTCFLYNNGIVTAKHCIVNAKKIAIQGITKGELDNVKFEIHDNEKMDLLYIRFENPKKDTIYFSQNAEVLDEVLTLGFPKMPGYQNFLTAEHAIISSRYTTSRGQVASLASDIWMKEELYLITAKIKGGNSGGPVINNNGSVIGVAVNISQGEGNYDDLGYGTVIPVSFVDELISKEVKKYLDTSNIKFHDFE